MHWLKLLSRVTGKFLKCKGTFTYTLYYSEIALEIINSDHWDKAMRMCTENNVTPMRLLIEFMPGIIKQLCKHVALYACVPWYTCVPDVL